MGFKDAASIIDQFLSLCGDDRQRILYNLFGENPASLPADLRFDVSFTDASSLQFQLFGVSGARTGADIRDGLQHRINEEARVFGTRRLVFCFDDRDNVTEAKLRERRLRALASGKRVEPYTGGVQLTTGETVDCLTYAYGLDTPLPAEHLRVMATPPLLRRAMNFLCDLIANHITHPLGGAEEVILMISGYTDPSNCTSRTFKKLFLEEVDFAVPKIYNGCGVGEGEGQCIYWMRQSLADKTLNARRFLIRANDSDALALALLNVRELYDPTSKKINGSLWLDFTQSQSKIRFIDVVRMWRSIKAGLLAIKPSVALQPRTGDAHPDMKMARPDAPGVMHLLRNDIESVLVVAMLCGNDYCKRLPQLGPGTLFKFFEQALIAPIKSHATYLVHMNASTGDTMINERALVALIARAYISIKYVRELAQTIPAIANHANGLTTDKLWLYEERRQRPFFDQLAAATAATPWVMRNSRVLLPNYEMVRAHVRRAFFSLYYYTNVAVPARQLHAFRVDGKRNLSLFGHKPFDDYNEAETEDVTLFGLSTRVLLTCNFTGIDLQPFVHSVLDAHIRGPELADKKRTVEQLSDGDEGPPSDPEERRLWDQKMMERALQITPRFERARNALLGELRDGPNEAWIDTALRRSTDLDSFRLPDDRADVGEHGSYLRTPVYVAPPEKKSRKR